MATGPDFRFTAPYAGSADRAEYDAGLRAHMLRVYNYMCGGLALTGIIAYIVGNSPDLLYAVHGTPLKWVVMLAPFGFMMFAGFKLNTMASGTLQALFWAFSAVMGLSLSYIFAVYTGGSIARVFFITSGMFAGTSLWGYTTKRDLTGMGNFLFMGLIGILIASVVNIFLGSSGLQFAISVIGVLVFTGLTAYDTQRIKETYDEAHGHESNTKLAVWGAWGLYMNFINMFLMLLQLFGERK
jgi:uncharacterized protein